MSLYITAYNKISTVVTDINHIHILPIQSLNETPNMVHKVDNIPTNVINMQKLSLVRLDKLNHCNNTLTNVQPPNTAVLIVP